MKTVNIKDMDVKNSKANKKKVNKHRKEKIMFAVLILVLLAIPICNVYTKAMLSESNIKLEQVKYDIKHQERVNESLKTEISELASLDKIRDVATAEGLSYQNNNIKVVTNE